MKLDYFAIKNETDKSSLVHGYCEHYEDAIELYLSKHNIKSLSLLEIGVYAGSSLRMWRDYFNDLRINYNIIGIDLNPSSMQANNQESGIFVEIGDQTDMAFLNDVVNRHGPFDIIIDDGSHIVEHQKKSFTFLFEYLKPGGIYIIEDVCTSYWSAFNERGNSSIVDFCKKLVDDVNFYGIAPDGKTDRNEKKLVQYARTNSLKINTSIRSVHFFNSTILIQKRIIM